MIRYAVLSCLLICLLTHKVGAQTKVSINNTSVSTAGLITGNGSITIDAAEIYVTTTVIIYDSNGKMVASPKPEFGSGDPAAGTTVLWTATSAALPSGTYKMTLWLQTTLRGNVKDYYDYAQNITVP